MGIEPTLAAWEAAVLPLNYTRLPLTILGWRRIRGQHLGGTGYSCTSPSQVPELRILQNHIVTMALAMESRGHFEALNAPLLYTGVGKVNAAMALTRRLTELRAARHPLPLVINLGTAGSRSLPTGSLVACDRFTQRDMDVTALGVPRGTTPFDDAPPVIECARFFTTLPHFTCSSGDSFATDAPASDSDVIDMEAFALARVCHAEGAAFACAKFITDGADGNAANDWRESLERAARALAELYARSVQVVAP